MIIYEIQRIIDEKWVRTENGEFGKNLISDKANIMFSQQFQSKFYKELIYSATKLRYILIHLLIEDRYSVYQKIEVDDFETYSITFDVDYDANSISERVMEFLCQLRKILNDGITEDVDYSTTYSKFNEEYLKAWWDNNHCDTLFDPMTGVVIDIKIKDRELILSAHYVFHKFDWEYKMKREPNED